MSQSPILFRELTDAEKFELARCEHKITTPIRYRGRNKQHQDICANHAVYMVDGRRMCVRHAQAVALEVKVAECAVICLPDNTTVDPKTTGPSAK